MTLETDISPNGTFQIGINFDRLFARIPCKRRVRKKKIARCIRNIRISAKRARGTAGIWLPRDCDEKVLRHH